MGLGGVISNLRYLGAKILPFVSTFAQAGSSSSSSSAPVEGHEIEADLKRLMKILEGIEAKLYDAEERVIRDCSLKLWLKELQQVAYDAEDLLDDYHYEVLRTQVEARDASPPNPRKRKQVQVPDNMFRKIKGIMDRFCEIERHRLELRLFHEDAPRRADTELQIAPTSHFVVDSNIFGREREKKDLIDLLSSECHDGNTPSVVTIVGIGGLGKTTLSQLVYNDERIKKRFDKFGWVGVLEDFSVERLTSELVECLTKKKCVFTNLSTLQDEMYEAVRDKRVLLVLDDVWNENASLWETFRAPFGSATLVKILVTTRNEHVAQIMQLVKIFKLHYLLEERCWQLFQHYAFGQVNQNEGSQMAVIGKQIMKKCGGLPLAVKSIASLLRHEKEEESWREILESELWESNASNAIFRPLQISYAHLPTYLKPCFLYCSMFPKGQKIYVHHLIRLWTYQGLIKSNGKNNPELIGWQYAKQLWQRSFLEGEWDEKALLSAHFKLHDVVHDLARFNSDNGCYSIEAGRVPDFPKELCHLYVGVKLQKPLPCVKITALRTLIIHSNARNVRCPSDFPRAHKFRALELSGPSLVRELEFLSSRDNFKHLRYLFLYKFSFGELPKSICSLYHLQTLTFLSCTFLQELPKEIGNLLSLEELKIHGSGNLKTLPKSSCQLQALRKLDLTGCYELEELPSDMGELTNLQSLSIIDSGISYLPPSLNKLSSKLEIKGSLCCKTIDWLKDLVDLGGKLSLYFSGYMPSSTDVQCAPLVSMSNLKCLQLCWRKINNYTENKLELEIEGDDQNISSNDQMDLSWLEPHPNLTELHICFYGGVTLPEWIRNPISCASLSKIVITACNNIVFLPFGGLCSLKCLEIKRCSSLWHLGTGFLPPGLQKLVIDTCTKLKYVSGMRKSLEEIYIKSCWNLQFLTDAELFYDEFPYQKSLLGLRNLTSLRSLQFDCCYDLQMSINELPPVESCKVEVSCCPGLKGWCLQHNIAYKGVDDDDDEDDDDDDDDDVDDDDGDDNDDDDDDDDEAEEDSDDNNYDDDNYDDK